MSFSSSTSKQDLQVNLNTMGLSSGSGGGGAGAGAGSFGGSGSGSGGGLSAPRPHLNALSPLQSFSPLQPLQIPSTNASKSRSHSRHPSYQSSTHSSPSTSFGGGNTVVGAGGFGMTGLNHHHHPHPHPHSHHLQQPSHTRAPLSASNLYRHGSSSSITSLTPSDAIDPHDPHHAGHGSNPSVGSRPRTPSVTRSLSRRESIVGAGFTSFEGSGSQTPIGGRLGTGGGERAGGMSKLTLVRAPSRGKGGQGGKCGVMDEPGSVGVQGRKRAKSGGNLSPFTLTPSSPMSTSTSGPANLFSPISPSPFARSLGPADLGPSDSAAPGAQQTGDHHHTISSSHRASFLFDQQAAQNPHNHIHSESKNLSPDQVMDLVQGLRSPVLATHQDEIPTASTPKRSGLSRSSSLARIRAESEVSNVSRTLDEGKAGSGGEAAGGLELEPVEYVEMNDDVLLPFVDRVAEVAELVEQPSNAELFEIIRPTFPKQSKASPSRPDSWRAVDPEDWTWEEFQSHLALTRAEADDYDWIRSARKAVRARSEALWERIGTCLGCDGDLLNAGGEEPHTGYALSDVFEASTTAGSPLLSAHPDDHFGFGHVWVEGLSATEPEEIEYESAHPSSLGQRHLDDMSLDGHSPLPGISPALMDVVEEEEPSTSNTAGQTTNKTSLTPAQIAGGRGELTDPFGKTSPTGAKRRQDLPGSISPESKPKVRAKSFVGVQICTSPSMPGPQFVHRPSYSGLLPGGLERGPGHPLFPSSFSTLSIAPTLPNNNPALKASLSFTQASDAMQHSGQGNPARAALQSMMGFSRKKSRSGLSESAITFASEDD